MRFRFDFGGNVTLTMKTYVEASPRLVRFLLSGGFLGTPGSEARVNIFIKYEFCRFVVMSFELSISSSVSLSYFTSTKVIE